MLFRYYKLSILILLILFSGTTYSASGTYTIKVDIKGITTLTSGTSYWSMRNATSGNRMFIQKVFLTSEFVGVAAASLSMFALFRYSGATPSGGNAINPTKLDSASDASNLLDARFATGGLTMTGTSVEANPIFITSTINQLVTSVNISPFNSSPLNPQDNIILQPGEGIVIQSFNTVIAGIGLHGIVQWSEGI